MGMMRFFVALTSTATASALNLFGLGAKGFEPPVVMGDEAIMSKKAHGTSATPVQKNLRWNCDFETADRICSARAHERSTQGPTTC